MLPLYIDAFEGVVESAQENKMRKKAASYLQSTHLLIAQQAAQLKCVQIDKLLLQIHITLRGVMQHISRKLNGG